MKHFLERKFFNTKINRIAIHHNLSFCGCKILSENLINHYEYIRNNLKDIDKHKLNEFDNIPLTYHGTDLNEFEKDIFDRLPNIGKWQWSNYSRIWRALEEADECLMEFVYHEANYLCQGPTKKSG